MLFSGQSSGVLLAFLQAASIHSTTTITSKFKVSSFDDLNNQPVLNEMHESGDGTTKRKGFGFKARKKLAF